MPQDHTERPASATRMTIETAVARERRLTMPVLELSGETPATPWTNRAASGLPSVRKRPSGTQLVRRWDSADLQHSIRQQNCCQTYVTIGVLSLFTCSASCASAI